MKYFTSLALCIIPGILVFAGINKKHQQKNIDHYKVTADNKTYPKITYYKKDNISVVYDSEKSTAPVGEVIGKTTFDLQTNTGMCRRVATSPNGRFTYVGWTHDFSFSPGAANRGTGFNFYENTSGLWQNEPTARIEPDTRTGWPNIGVSEGRQFSIAHTRNEGMIFTYRTGNSEWQEKPVGLEANDPSGVWARAVADPPYIYCIISRQSSGEPEPPINPFFGALNFIRSSNNGNDWESLGPLEEDYRDTFPLSIGGDTYQIDAANGIVSVIVGSGLNSIVLYKSNNRGDDWTKQIILQNSNPFFQNISENSEVEDFTVDPYFGSDGGNTIIIDSKGTTHIVYSSRVNFNLADNDDVKIGAYYLFRGTAALFYWNESMGNTGPKIIGKSIMYDADADGQLGSSIDRLIEIGEMPYYSNMVCHPQLAIDAEDNLYLSYSATVDGHFVPEKVDFLSSDDKGEILPYQAEFELNAAVYSDVFMLKSTDDGNNWQGPLNVTNAAASEEAYGSIQRFIHDTIMLAYQHDPLPGTLLQKPEQHLATINEIAVVKIVPEDISDDIAPPDSEPYLTILYDSLTLTQGCSVINEFSLQQFSFGMDYPDGLITEIKTSGLIDYSQLGNYTEELYVEDSAGNKSDPVQVYVEIVADEAPPLIEVDQLCNPISIFVGSDWQLPEVTITDLAEFDGVVEPSSCDISENLVVNNNVNVNEIGTYSVTYSVSDFAGNESNLELTINVIEEDTEGPVITFENFRDEIDQYEEISESDFIITAIDNVDCENIEINVIGIDSINTEIIGTYEITVMATDQSNNTTTETKTIIVCPNGVDPCEIVNVDDHSSSIPIALLYPNPAKEAITIEIENYFNATNNQAFKIQISDLAGKNVYSSNEVMATSHIEHTINTSNLQRGLYLVSIFNKNININKKIVVNSTTTYSK